MNANTLLNGQSKSEGIYGEPSQLTRGMTGHVWYWVFGRGEPGNPRRPISPGRLSEALG